MAKKNRTRAVLDEALHDIISDFEDFKVLHGKLLSADAAATEGKPYFAQKSLEIAKGFMETARRYVVEQLYPQSKKNKRDESPEGEISDDSESDPKMNAESFKGLFAGLKAHTTQVINGSKNLSGIRMPTIEIPKFDGDARAFRSFEETFNMVAGRSRDSDIEMLALLRGKLGGDALKLVSHLTITEMNYERTWELLRERYFNKRKLKESEIDVLLDLPEITTKNIFSLRSGVDRVREVLYNLKSLGVDTDS